MGLIKPSARPADAVLPLVGFAAMLAVFAPANTPPPPVPGGETRTTQATQEPPPVSHANLEDVRPVLNTIAEAMGERTSRPARDRSAIELDEELSRGTHGGAVWPSGGAEADADADLHGRRRAAADEARQRSNEALLDALVQRSVNGEGDTIAFAIALVPDYVDSQSGWMADHIVSGIQAGFSDARYALDRFFLPDWAPRDDGAAQKGARTDHERQPGVILFRRAERDGTRPTLYAVCVVLETPTAGPHTRALKNAIDLVRFWQTRRAVHTRSVLSALELDVIGPTFSGSIDPLVAVLRRESAAPTLTPALAVRVFNGSANAERNDRVAADAFIRYYGQYVSDVDVLQAEALRFLDERGYRGCRIALLVEETSFGEQAIGSKKRSVCSGRIFHFPLHVAQLRTASSAAPVVPRNVLGRTSVPIDIREHVTATDFLPAVRPGMVSPTVEVTFRSLLKTMRLEGVSVVGIVATDARDALFLARELRRSAPSVQLVLFGAQSLYLHPEYAPFVRGAIVASTYPLAPSFDAAPLGRRGFASQEAQGTYVAVGALLAAPGAAAREPSRPTGATTPPVTPRIYENKTVWLSVVGSDAFWPLRVEPTASGALSLRTSSIAWLVLLACMTFIGAFVIEGVRARRGLGLLAPPARARWGRFAHAVNVAQSGAIVSVLAFGSSYVLLAKSSIAVFSHGPASLIGAIVPGVLVLGLSASVAVRVFLGVRRGAVATVREYWARMTTVEEGDEPARRKGLRAFVALCLGALLVVTTFAATFALLAWIIEELVLPDEALRSITLVRLLSGGIVSPVPAALLLVASLLVPVVWDRLRGTQMGAGYRYLANHSPAFRYLFGADSAADANLRGLAASLETPLPSLRLRRLVIVLLAAVALMVVLFRHGLSLDGWPFSRFLMLATFTTLVRAALLLFQATQTWRRLGACLGRMKHEPIMAALEAVHSRHMNWDVSLFAARVDHLRPIIGLARRLDSHPAVVPVAAGAALHDTYTRELVTAPRRPLAVSDTWLASWTWVEALVPALRSTAWATSGLASAAALAGRRPSPKQRVGDAELMVALHLAFILRDMVSRVMMTLGNALTSIGLLTLAHLLYIFQGRSVYLFVDVLALIAAAGIALWLLLSVERDFVLSVLRDSKPGHVEFNATFVRNLGGYVVVPVLAALGAVFPEIGVHFAGALEPLRRFIVE